MQFVCQSSPLAGAVDIPASKSHTIRAVTLATLADGPSIIKAPLDSADTRAALNAAEAFSARITKKNEYWTITGAGPRPTPCTEKIDVENSGTTLRIMMGVAALMPADKKIELTGDEQILKRPAGPLLKSLNDLGAKAVSTRSNDCPPYRIGGRLKGGRTRIEARSSQYLTSLLMACPLADEATEIEVPLLFEGQYVGITLWWLREQGIRYDRDALRHFRIPGGQVYKPFERRIPADFSSATFFFGAGALGSNDVVCRGLDIRDTQGDKAVLEYLREMGAKVELRQNGDIRIAADSLRGIEIDMNDTPDALPVMAVLGCFAEGTTILRNVAHARIKETDRITVMAEELGKMGARIEELEDGLTIQQSDLKGARLNGHGDHRVVMALALAGLNAPGKTVIDTAEAAGVTFPDFAALMRSLGASLREESD